VSRFAGRVAIVTGATRGRAQPVVRDITAEGGTAVAVGADAGRTVMAAAVQRYGTHQRERGRSRPHRNSGAR
jgi:NAD(P)-dependent dehydrogenase (short-subunit alcohol dehydrogenase family)